MVDLGFGQQDVPFVVFLRHFVLLLFASVFPRLCAFCDSKPISVLRFSALSFSSSARHLWKARSWLVR